MTSLPWSLHRQLVQLRVPPLPFPRTAEKRWLLISEQDLICTTQIFPFFHYANRLKSQFKISVREISLERFRQHHPYEAQVDAVAFQTSVGWKAQEIIDFAEQLRDVYPRARIAYFDWFAPTDMRFATPLGDRVDAYLKKHILRDRAQYELSTLGETNLTDYYSHRLNLGLEPFSGQVPATFWNKVVLGPNFALSAHMLPYFTRLFPTAKRTIDLHARIAIKGTPWYEGMRREALLAAEALPGKNVVSSGRVTRETYFRELFVSKLCFSPFGYGEVCWRDYEAAFTGALLLKPDMGHVETCPDIFVPYQTYVPLRWDLADLEEKTRYYLEHEDERRGITERAFTVIKNYLANDLFLDQIRPLLSKLE